MLHDLNQLLLDNAILNTIFSTLFGALFGLVVGFIAGRISARFSGRIAFAPYISKTATRETASGFKYLIQFWHAGWRDIVDVKFSARLRIKGLESKKPGNFSSYLVLLGRDDLFRMRRHDGRHIARLDVAEISELNKPTYAQYIFKKFTAKGIICKTLYGQHLTELDFVEKDPDLLEHLMSVGSEAFLEITVIGNDTSSNARKDFIKIYTLDDVRQRPFRKESS